LGKSEKPRVPGHVFSAALVLQLLNRISETPLIDNFTGFGLYDREVVEALRRIPDRRPYFRGLIAELAIPGGGTLCSAARERGVTSNNFYALYDTAMMA